MYSSNQTYKKDSKMKVNKMGLATVIRKIVRDEVDKVLTERITTVLENIDNKTIMAANTPVTTKQKKVATPNPKNKTLAAVLKETADSGEWRTMGDGPMTTKNMGNILNKQYSELTDQPADIATSVATAEGKSAQQLPDKLTNALNRDYSELVKTFDK